MIKNTTSRSSMDQRIDSLKLSEPDRQAAKEHMREADRFADLFGHAADKLRSAEGLLASLFVQRAQ